MSRAMENDGGGNRLVGAFAAHARRAAQAIAVRAGRNDVTYASLLAATARYAAALERRGIGDADVVALETARTPETIALLLAVAACGAAYLPLEPDQTDARLAAMIEDARPRLLIGARALRMRLPAAGPWLDRAALNATRALLAPRRSGALAYVLFTSGSTGRPKGVAMRTQAVAALIDWHARHPRLGAAARTLQFAPFGFDVSFQEIFSTLASGGALVLPTEAERRDPWALLALLRRERIERAFLPAVALQALAEAAAADRAALPATLADVITAGEQLRITPALRALFCALPQCVLHNHYGPTETHVVTAHELHAPAAAWPELPPIGTPLPHVRVRLEVGEAIGERRSTLGEARPAHASEAAAAAPRTTETSQAAPAIRDFGSAIPAHGELLLGGDCLAAGYVAQPELTAQRFVEIDGERWYRTGDLVRRGERGELHYVGRLDDQVKIGGSRVEPAEVEAVLCRHGGVAQAVVVAECGHGETRLAAHVVPRDASAPPQALERALRAHAAAALPEYLRPQRIVLHALLPTTPSGKVDRRELAREWQAPGWQESAPLESQLTALWQGLIGNGALGAEDNLFDAGARSLTVVRALTELRRRGHVVSVAQIYEHPTIAAQAALLGAPRRPAPVAADRARGQRQRAALARFAPGARP